MKLTKKDTTPVIQEYLNNTNKRLQEIVNTDSFQQQWEEAPLLEYCKEYLETPTELRMLCEVLQSNNPSKNYFKLVAFARALNEQEFELFDGEPDFLALSEIGLSYLNLKFEESDDRPYWVDQRSVYGTWRFRAGKGSQLLEDD